MTSMALWHLELLPGQKYPVMVQRDFRITNAALGEEVVDENARSVVKITHQPVNPRDLADDSDSDDDFSTDEEEDEDEEVDMEKLMAAMNGKKGKKASAEEEEEEDEDEDDEDDEDFEEPAVTAVVCSLIPGKIEQTQLNLTFVSEEVVMFEVTGKNPVHLMGNYIHQDHHDHGEDYDESDDEDFSLEGDSDDEDISMADEASHRFEEVKEDGKSKKADAAKENANKKRKAETQEADSKRSTASAAEKKAPAPAATEKKAEQPAKKQKTETAKPAEKKKEAAEKPEQKSSKKQTLPSGLIIEDFKIGDGPVAKKGKRLGMRYIGKLTNGKVFDSNTSGQPFNFRLGAGEVIKGWDQGIEGMAVGGERKLTIPAKLAYGSQKLPGIPASSTLCFEIKLVSVR